MHKTVSRNAQTHKQKYKHINNQTDTFPSKDSISKFTNTKNRHGQHHMSRKSMRRIEINEKKGKSMNRKKNNEKNTKEKTTTTIVAPKIM